MKQLDDLEAAMKMLNGLKINIAFDTDDQASIDAAIRNFNHTVDAKIARYRNTPGVKEITQEFKNEAKSSILNDVKIARRGK